MSNKNNIKYQKDDVFLKPTSVGEREWGDELMLHVCSGSYTFKLLKMKKGTKGGLQYHRLKDESAYLVSGEMLIRFDLNDGKGLQEEVILPGSAIRFPPGLVHQEEALTEVIIIEASTPHLNDRVRMEEEYNLTLDSGLPTTNENEIQKL